MNMVFFVLGVVLLVAAVVDLLWTALWVDGGGGPLSSRLMADTWRGLRQLADGRSHVLSFAGPLLVVQTFLLWIGLILAGWMFIFASAEGALVDTQSQQPISWFDLFYFVAYSIFTLGIGDIVPTDGVWQIATVLATASGMLFITMSVSYVISILGVVARKRAFASSVTAIGGNSEEFVMKGWDGDSFDGFDLILNSLAEEIDYLAYQYNAYPILHYYHTRTDEHASAVGITILNEGLTLLRCGVPDEHQPNRALVENAFASTQHYIDTRSKAFIPPADQPPPPPNLDRLREVGSPTVSDEEFEAALEDYAEQRRQLLGMVQTDAREWPSSS